MKKFTKNYLLLCDHAFLSEGGKLNVLGVFETINLAQIPGVHLKCALVGNISINDSSIKDALIEVSLKDPEANSVLLNIPGMKMPVSKVSNEPGKINFILELGNLKFEKEGIYTFVVKVNGEHLADYEFMVNKVKENKRVD